VKRLKLSACTANLIDHQKIEAKMEEVFSANLVDHQDIKAMKTQMEENCSANLKTHQDLKSQMEETCAAKNENLQNLIQFKLKEIAELRGELEASKLENNAKNDEIKSRGLHLLCSFFFPLRKSTK
jgi:hypothetical protein